MIDVDFGLILNRTSRYGIIKYLSSSKRAGQSTTTQQTKKNITQSLDTLLFTSCDMITKTENK